ncbi:unnamed protein product [Agarophyton chilense]
MKIFTLCAAFVLLLCSSSAHPLERFSPVQLPHLSLRASSLAACGYDTFQSGSQTLFAGRDQREVGSVEFTLSSSGISVEYSVIDGCVLKDDIHVNIVNQVLETVRPGRFPCKDSVSGSPTTVSITCPATSFTGLNCCERLYVYTHGVVSCQSGSDTVYAGVPVCTGRGQWCNAVIIDDPPCECACENDACVVPQDCAISNPGSCDSGVVKCPAACAPGPDVSCGAYPETCTSGPVCDSAECEDTEPCDPDECPPEGVCPNAAASFDAPKTCVSATPCECGSGTYCKDKSECATQPITCGSDTCDDGMMKCPGECEMPSVDCGAYPDTCTSGPVCDSADCEDTEPCDPDECPPEGVCPNAAASFDAPKTCVSATPCECGSGTYCKDKSECATQPIMCGSDTCDEGVMKCEKDCVMPSDCGLPDCSITECPDKCPTKCCDPCPPCFKPDPDSTTCNCIPDANDTCDPCVGGGNALCGASGLPPRFQCCPPTSGCKSSVIPRRLNSTPNDLRVSFICSSSCGESCDVKTSMGESRACSLFDPVPLGTDNNPDTDDVFDTCPDLAV